MKVNDVESEFNIAKFSQHSELLKKLISTGNKTLAEDAWYDKVWGCWFGHR